MKKGRKPKTDNPEKIKVVVKNRPTKEQAELKIKQLSEFLSNNRQGKNTNPLD